MDEQIEIRNQPPFNEDEWLKLIFLLSDTQDWLNEMVSGAVMQLPMNNKKRLFRKNYYITISSLAHILERHYYKIPRYPDSGKFTIPIPDIPFEGYIRRTRDTDTRLPRFAEDSQCQ